MAKLRKNFKDGFAVVPNHLLNNPDISWKAKGLFGYIQSKPDGWDFAVERMCKESSDKKDSTRNGLLELEKGGYLTRRKFKNEAGQWDIEYEINMEHRGGLAVTENPSSENPSSENPKTKKERISKKEIVRNNYIEEWHISFAKIFLDNSIYVNAQSAYLTNTEDKYQEQIKKGADAIEKMCRIDGLEREQIYKILQATMQHQFWNRQVLNVPKLRMKNKNGVPYWMAIVDDYRGQNVQSKKKGPTISEAHNIF